MNKNIWEDNTEFRRWNEKMCQLYDPDNFHNHPNLLIRLLEKERVKWVIKHLHPENTEKILDVGCGAGNILIEINNSKLFGVDLSTYLIKKCKTKCSSVINKIIHLTIADGQYLPFKTNSFDKVICSEVAEHVVSPITLLSEIARIIKPGGSAVFTIPNEALIVKIRKFLKVTGLFKFFFKNISLGNAKDKASYQNEWHLHYFDKHTFKNVLSRYFTIMKKTYLPSKFFTLHVIYNVRVKKDV